MVGQAAQPAPSCTPADVFTDCFTGCTTPAACGWTVLSPAGTATFDGDEMVMGPFGGFPQGEAEKALAVPMPSVSMTAQFRFSEMAGPVSANKVYDVAFSDAIGSITLEVILGGGPTVNVRLGPAMFVGVWSPVGGGASHTVHITVDGAGVPTLFIDGAPIALVPDAPFPVAQNPSTVRARIFDAGMVDGQGSFDWIFAATGILPLSTAFCCPGGGPPE